MYPVTCGYCYLCRSRVLRETGVQVPPRTPTNTIVNGSAPGEWLLGSVQAGRSVAARAPAGRGPGLARFTHVWAIGSGWDESLATRSAAICRRRRTALVYSAPRMRSPWKLLTSSWSPG